MSYRVFVSGHVTIGGSICMQMLTRSGWSPSNDIEVGWGGGGGGGGEQHVINYRVSLS